VFTSQNNIIAWIENNLGLFLFIVMALIGMFTLDNYGITWDEMIQRKTGLLNFNYIFLGDDALFSWKDKNYGVAFELPLIFLEKTLNLTDIRDIFLLRHGVNHLFFLVGASYIYKLINFLYKNKLHATIAFFMIVLHPRLYAHSFFNTKDIPFLSMFIISFYYFAIAFKNKSIYNFIVLGICAGILINLRIMGVLIPSMALLFLLIDAVKKKAYQLNIKLGFILLTTSTVLLIVSWPYLWLDPINNFIEAFKAMSSFAWKNVVLFNGEFIKGEDLPWYYIPVWFSITTPIIYLVIGFLGITILVTQVVKNNETIINNTINRNNSLYFACFFVPVIAVIVMKSTLYDGWRQMYFIYPSFVLLALFGVNNVSKMKRKILIGAMVISFISSSIFMIFNAPFQQVYFNQFVSSGPPEELRERFEMDYWGASYLHAFEYILEKDVRDLIYINVANTPGYNTFQFLMPEQRHRIRLVSIEDADYFISNFRFHPNIYKDLEKNVFHSIKVDDNTINRIYKLD
jgi:heme/copper-type cytochrome/quinol oxidase subunit 2